MTRRIQLFVAGEWREGNGVPIDSRNPAKLDEVLGAGAAALPEDVDAAVASARSASETWRRTPMHERASILLRAAVLLEERAEQYGRELTLEEGKTLPEGVGEVRRAAEIFRFNAGQADREVGEIFSSPRAAERILVVRKPVGVIGVITPWNFPIAIPAWKIAPALVHGNTIVWKPASVVPLLAMRLTEVLAEAGLPAGVLSLLIGPGVLGSRIAGSPDVDAVTFTGSTSVGTGLLELCAPLRRPVQAEMGGKNAALVFADADLDLAAEQIVQGAMRSTGQKCTATSRLVVDAEVADELVERVATRVRELVVADGLQPGVDVGPAVSTEARAEIESAIRDAVAVGGRVIAQADAPDADCFVRPTVLETDVSDPIWRDEVFGPVLSVARFHDEDQAIKMANDGPFGLSSAVFTRDLARSLRILDHLDVGVVHVNSESAGADPHVPFGGAKASGIGPKEQGRASREFFTSTTTAYLR
ncbi:aldehyde dehydrogenase family protein [Nocardioides sp. AE5]|uniref:aldehyde dehydrogenase family protein n=1 Tax=Nocardioides sp. AE5 TaxID=2962573 RepID=UPI0028828F2A|nr:aldehyde dehydrogenase family protein [Nocardioides sp. AE5]MDT0202485.1 aldehyde dehydrogenase family protein [Nocardioides sp. AE5]